MYRQKGPARNGWKWWIIILLLSMFTLGIGSFIMCMIWLYHMFKETKEFTLDEDLPNPKKAMFSLLLFLIPGVGWLVFLIVMIVIIAKYTSSLRASQEKIGMTDSQLASPVIIILTMFIFSLGYPIWQSSMNKTWEHMVDKGQILNKLE